MAFSPFRLEISISSFFLRDEGGARRGKRGEMLKEEKNISLGYL